jgi:hypothetical protein
VPDGDLRGSATSRQNLLLADSLSNFEDKRITGSLSEKEKCHHGGNLWGYAVGDLLPDLDPF